MGLRPELVQQPRRPLDVGEQERDRAGGLLHHSARILCQDRDIRNIGALNDATRGRSYGGLELALCDLDVW
jgi:hypothetical protein